MFIKNILILVALIVLYKIFYNLYYFLTAKYYYKKYIEFIKESKDWFIREHKQSIVRLFEKAGIEDAYQPRTEPAGFGLVRSSSFSVFRNLSVIDEEIIPIINGNFREAIGIYKQRIYESFNPIFWIEFFINLPVKILNFLGFRGQNVFVKIIQLIWWIIVCLSTLVGIFFNSDFISWIKQFGL